MSKRKSPFPFNINDVADAETVDYKYDTNINDVSSDNSAQIAAKKTVNKYKNLIWKRKITLELKKDINPIKKFPTLTSETKTGKFQRKK